MWDVQDDSFNIVKKNREERAQLPHPLSKDWNVPVGLSNSSQAHQKEGMLLRKEELNKPSKAMKTHCHA